MDGHRKAKLEGYIGHLIDDCIQNGVMETNFQPFIRAFQEKLDSEGLFCGEFWGKWFTSAVAAYKYEPKQKYQQVLDEAIKGILATQEADGRISASAEDFTPWDIWGRKYVLLGLLSYYDLTHNKHILDCVQNMMNQLISRTVGDHGRKIVDTGLEVLRGLSSCSILQPIVLLYERTHIARYLTYAKDLVNSWSLPSVYSPEGLRLLEQSVPGCVPATIGTPKAYEIMSCFAGVLELYRVTGEGRYLEAVEAYMEAVTEREIMITGSGSSGELWCEGKFRQTQLLETPMETCVTVTYMKVCRQLLEITQDVKWANRLEFSLYNALAGAINQDGSWWAYFSPLQGQRVLSHVQIESMETSCCVANGPRALLEVPEWCITPRQGGIAVNLYEAGRYYIEYEEQPVVILQNTDYPVSSTVRLRLEQVPENPMSLSLRIPEWAEHTEVRIEKEVFYPAAGTYCEMRTKWRKHTEIQIDFNTQVKIVTAPGMENYKALTWGSLVLAMDRRYVEESANSLWLMNDAMKLVHDSQMERYYYTVQSIQEESDHPIVERIEKEGTLVAFRVKFLKRPIHFFGHETEELLFCDYASCGKDFTEKSTIRTWFPVPMYCGDIFPKESGDLISGAPVVSET
ncbi:MAG: glycoside hydrolase family 127 protein [Clostridiales bacterium]|nr:glycoside hydrolase family 127 protein [Clostridiales bacterium]